MTSSDILLVPGHVMARHAGQETVLLDLDSGVYYTLDEIGSRIWELAAEARTLAEVSQSLIDEYDVDAATAERDVLEFASELEGRGLMCRRSDVRHTTT